jgi:Transposase IS66 family
MHGSCDTRVASVVARPVLPSRRHLYVSSRQRSLGSVDSGEPLAPPVGASSRSRRHRALARADVLSEREAVIRGDHLGGFLADHDHRGVGVPADDIGHHRGVGDPQAGHALDPESGVDDIADPAGAGQVVDAYRVVAGHVSDQLVARRVARLVVVGLGQHPRHIHGAERCNREQFTALVGSAYPGIVVSDRWNGYSHLDPHRRQVCWSHLQRDFRRHADGLGEQKTFGEQGLALTRRVFAAWRGYQHEHHDRRKLQAEIAPIQTELRALLEQASPKKARNRWHRQFANNLLKIWPALWTFTITAGVEPTNNPAERALRTPIIHRKISLGTQSDPGERFAERALSAAATCRQQRRSLFTYLSELMIAHNRGDPFPALA